MRKSNHGFIYRFFVLLLAYGIFAAAIDISIVQGFKDNMTGIWIMVGVTIGVFIIIEVVNEIIIHLRKKKKGAESDASD